VVGRGKGMGGRLGTGAESWGSQLDVRAGVKPGVEKPPNSTLELLRVVSFWGANWVKGNGTGGAGRGAWGDLNSVIGYGTLKVCPPA